LIDLHCHLLPGIDDGAKDLDETLRMAQLAVADGILTTCCTPHIYPGLYENAGPDIQRRVNSLQLILADRQIPLTLSYGADAHLVPDFIAGLASKRIPTLAGSRYMLLEPPHHVRPPRFVESVFEVIAAGYVPVITHPERLTWAKQHFDDFLAIARSGGWLQVTGAALTGSFGRGVATLARQFVAEGWCDVLASDGHSATQRRPVLAEAYAMAQQLLGPEEARRLVIDRPQAVLANRPPDAVPRPPAHTMMTIAQQGKIQGYIRQLTVGARRFLR
jgi:protein-tyrosine phosphatase